MSKLPPDVKNSIGGNSSGNAVKSDEANLPVNGDKGLKELRNSLKLDFSPAQNSKKTLTTPDVIQFLRLTSPELEKLITQGVSVVTTPTPTQFLFPKTVTAQQEQYARGFLDALNHLHQMHGFVPATNLLSPGFLSTTSGVSTSGDPPIAVGGSKNNPSASTQDSVATTSAAAVYAANIINNAANEMSKIQSPTRPDTTLASILMQAVSGGLSPMGCQNYVTVPFATSSGGVAASMALLNMNRAGNQALLGVIPSSGNAVSGQNLTFATITQAQPINGAVPPAIDSNVVTANGLQFAPFPGPVSDQLKREELQFVDVTSTLPSSIGSDFPVLVAPTHVSEALARAPDDPQTEADFSMNVPRRSESPVSDETGSTSQYYPVDPGETCSINVKEQQKLKLERKRQRNRVAATKCRKRKIERIAFLEGELEQKKVAKQQSSKQIESLTEDIKLLKARILEHKARGCLTE